MHTPGKWQVAMPGDVDEHYGVLDGFGHTATVYGYPEEAAVAYANARLMASSPDLLAALIEVTDELGSLANTVAVDRIVDNARAVIAKATGDTHAKP